MLFAQVPHADARAAQQALLTAGALDTRTKVERDAAHAYFPVVRQIPGFLYVEREGVALHKPSDLSSALAPVLSDSEREALIGSYDLVGNIVIVEIPEALTAKEQLIAQAIFDSHKHVTTVLKKAHKHSGEFRTQALDFVAGERTTEALVVESGCKFLVDVEQVYFSVRLSTERLRVARLVQPGEAVLVLFSGAGPYTVVLAKHSLAAQVVGVEKNPVGHRYATQNIRLNKVQHARAFEADCADVSFLHEQYDRIIMPLPASSEQFIGAALAVAKPHCTLHVYKFGREGECPAIEGDIRERCEAAGFQVVSCSVTKAGHHAPFVFRWCFDVVVRKR